MDALEKDLRDFVNFFLKTPEIKYLSEFSTPLYTIEDLICVVKRLMFDYWVDYPRYFKTHNNICEEFFKAIDYENYSLLAITQKNLSTEFFEDLALNNKLRFGHKINIIKNNKFSTKFLTEHPELFPPEIWKKVYE